MKKVLLVFIAVLCVCVLFACVDVGPSFNMGEVGGNNLGNNVGGNGGGTGGGSDADRESDLILECGDYVFYLEDKNLRLFKLDNGDITLIDSQELPFRGSEMLISDEGVNVICRVSKEFFKDEEPDKTFYESTVEIIVFDVPQDDGYKLEVKNQYSLCGSLKKAKTIDDKLYIAATIYGTIEEAIGEGFRFDIEELDPPAEVNAPQTPNLTRRLSVIYCVSTKSAYTVYGSFVDFLVQDGKILTMHNFTDNDITTTMVVLYDETWEIKGSYYEESYAVYDNFSLAVNGDYVYFVTYCLNKGTNFTVLSGDNLEKVGEIRDLYPEEEPMSSIFIGGKFYFTRRIRYSKDWTYTYVNSLYIIDVSEPTNPEVVYESKFDNYSLYLYAVDDGNMIMFKGAGIRLYSLQDAFKFKDSLYLDDLESQFFGGDTRMTFFDKQNGRIFVFTGMEIEKAFWDLIEEKCKNGDYGEDDVTDKIFSKEFFTDEEKEKIMNMRMSGSFYVIEYTGEELKVVHKFEDLRTGSLSSVARDIRCIVKDGYIYVLYSGVAYSFDATDFTEKCVLDYANLKEE